MIFILRLNHNFSLFPHKSFVTKTFKNVLSVPDPYPIPVSYTHLDVYKRQQPLSTIYDTNLSIINTFH